MITFFLTPHFFFLLYNSHFKKTQRGPRYKLLLDALLKETPVGHPEHSDVTAALAKVNAATDICTC